MGDIYVVNRDWMGKFDPASNHIYQELPGALPGGVFFHARLLQQHGLLGAVGQSIQAFAISNAQLSSVPSSRTNTVFPYPGSTPSISANGAKNGIVWAMENSSNAVLHAYDSGNLAAELYSSNQASGGRDQFGTGNKFITPMIANGKVYVGTTNGVGVFGLLH